MSSQIRKKLTTLELDPPIGSWQKIASALDNAGDGMQFPKRLKDHSVVPPQHTWEQINYQLDEMALEGRTGENYMRRKYTPLPVPGTRSRKYSTTLPQKIMTGKNGCPLIGNMPLLFS